MTVFDDSILDGGGVGIAQALGSAVLVILVLLFVAILVPVAVLANLVPGVAGHAPGAPQTLATTPFIPSTRASPAGAEPIGDRALPESVGSVPVDVAKRYLGIRYVFGGTDPAVGLDCSGLVQLVFRQLGINLPRTAQQQYNATARIERSELQPGDLVFFARTYADPNDFVTHVGIYIGGGMQINAPTEGQVVSIQPVFTGFWGAHFLSGGRPIGVH
jgi:cell wall-associated NlpC family hydrolase